MFVLLFSITILFTWQVTKRICWSLNSKQKFLRSNKEIKTTSLWEISYTLSSKSIDIYRTKNLCKITTITTDMTKMLSLATLSEKKLKTSDSFLTKRIDLIMNTKLRLLQSETKSAEENKNALLSKERLALRMIKPML